MGTCDGVYGKRILLGVTGGIAAYKAIELLRRLMDRGAEVHVAMTKNAERFVPRLTFEALSRKPVLVDEFADYNKTAIGHIEFTDNLDLCIIAPATANLIGKLAAGIADDALSSALMALSCPLLIAPAMNERMYRNSILQRNLLALKNHGVKFVEPGTGSLACGVVGQGRLADIDRILEGASALLAPQDLAGRTVLITAGPTREFIDAVRFISNPSTGKMGYALAAAARARGAEVTLVSGATQLAPPYGVKLIPVVSARQMRDAVMEQYPQCRAVIMAAAVSDFRPAHTAERKQKKDKAETVLQLERTDDILLKLGEAKGDRLLVGFAAETDDLEQNAFKKLKEKNLDMIIANDLLKSGSGFGEDTNAVIIIDRTGKRTELPTMPKSEIAMRIIDALVALIR
jgi:phosphopantothenoylcysteine decarboxylase/phosphopantothenate--cysteine ligase